MTSLFLRGYTHIFLDKSSMNVTKYIEPPIETLGIGPHTSLCTNFDGLLFQVLPCLCVVIVFVYNIDNAYKQLEKLKPRTKPKWDKILIPFQDIWPN